MNASLYILAAIGIPLLLAASSIWRGFALSILWGWFIVPVFGLPALSIPFAIGLSLVVGFLTDHVDDKDGDWSAAVYKAAIGPAVALLIGWIVTKFI
jgi:high-affinity Fe2+/Pb2+ permease